MLVPIDDLPPLPELGATVLPSGGTRFRVWAPAARRVEVLMSGAGGERRVPLLPQPDGYHAAAVAGVKAGDRYRFLVDGAGPYPDPGSRFQPEGPHGPSEVVDPGAFRWTDSDWPGLCPEGLVIYELHTGAFTRAGTFDAIIPELGRLADLGVTALELMPVAEFPGRRNWGYDGVGLFAPSHVYGGPAGLRRLVDAAHRVGLGVILDVVYNHLGPDGNYLRAFSPDYFTDRYSTPWGDALNYDGAHSRPVRDFICANARRWLTEYRPDGLRLDAVHAIHDHGPVHIVQELAERARGVHTTSNRLHGRSPDSSRSVVIIAESNANDVRLIRPSRPQPPTPLYGGVPFDVCGIPSIPAEGSSPPRGPQPPPAAGGLGLDSVWADDFHHAVHVHLTGERDGYYASYTGSTGEIARAVMDGFIYQGQVSPATGRARGTRVTDEPAAAFVFCLQNHDQVGNRAEGERLATLVERDRYTAATALLLLAPETPLLFMGQEYGATTPFLYFTDHVPELGRLVTEGRREEFAGFPAFRDPARRARIPDPQAESSFLRSRLDPDERARNAPVERLHRDLLALRRDDPVLRVQDRSLTAAGAPSDEVVVMHRWLGGRHRLLITNLGAAARLPWDGLGLPTVPSGHWQRLWCSRDQRYGGDGATVTLSGDGLAVPERCSVLLGLNDGGKP